MSGISVTVSAVIPTRESVVRGCRNSRIVLVVFWLVILFQLTNLKYIWGLEGIARLANLSLLLVLSIYAIGSLALKTFDRRVWLFYVVPGLFVLVGMLVNIVRNMAADGAVLSYFGLMLPWAAYLTVPMMIKTQVLDAETLWQYF